MLPRSPVRRSVLFVAAVGAVLTVAVIGSQRKVGSLLLLDWAAKASPVASAPGGGNAVAVLLELGLRDTTPTGWSGKASVAGAKVVRREGYRFRDRDKLIEPDAWEAATHAQGGMVLKPKAVAKKLGRPATVGVVMHLTDVEPTATVSLEVLGEKAMVPLLDVVAGKSLPLWDGKAVLRRVSTATPLVTAKTEDDFPAAAYGPDGTLWVAYISYTLKEERRRAGLNQIAEEPKDFKEYYTPEFGDQLFVKYHRDGKWSEPIAITGANEDLVRCAIAVEGSGQAWVAYSANRQGNHDIYARSIQLKGAGAQLGTEQRLTKLPGPDLSPVMCTHESGRGVVLRYQAWTNRGEAYLSINECRGGNWEVEVPQLAIVEANEWHPAAVAGPDGKRALAFDKYSSEGDYDVIVSVSDPRLGSGSYSVAATPKFEARPSAAYDAAGRLWIAYEEGPEKWGKDYGALDDKDGNPLYNRRSVRVACLVDGKLFKPAAELPTSTPVGAAQFNLQTIRYGYPKLGLDGKGRLWLTLRMKLPTPFGVQPGTEWITVARRLDGDKWTEPIEIHHSDGLLDHRPVMLPHPGGGLLVITNSDGRYATPGQLDNNIYLNHVDLPGDPIEPKLVAVEMPAKQPNAAETAERAAVKRMRDYRLEVAGKKYQLLRGEFHRHTEISFDGGGDGSLEDMFRYGIDAAAMDWIGNADHDNGGGREYTWWLTQKFTDAYQIGAAFTPLHSYERSVQYPMGHRNCLFVRRGIRTLPRLAEPEVAKRVGGVHADDTKMLYRYLHELDGICASHTSATSMGTDWRDNDPVVEPIVEIYQGDRNNYEIQAAPRAGHDPQSGVPPASIGGWQPLGFLNLAFAKGYKFGFQASSDHISTHISYCVALAEQPGRQGIVGALKKRHCYAATDDIVLEFRSGEHLMGDAFKTTAPPTFQMRVVGTKPLAKVEVLKDSQVVATFQPDKAEYAGTWTDPKPAKGTHYYYVRVQQTDGELAWASPLWVEYAP